MNMLTSWFLRGAAWLLVCLPADTPLLRCAVEWPPLAQELRQLAEEEEWLDRRDDLVRRPGELLYWSRRLHGDLAGCPHREELLRWPTQTEVEDALAVGHAYLRTCRQQRQVESAFAVDTRAWSQAEWDTRLALAPWQALAEAHQSARSPRSLYHLRESLQRVRCLVGETRWANRTLPSPVPLWHFRRMD
jgi:hypothetical protein